MLRLFSTSSPSGREAAARRSARSASAAESTSPVRATPRARRRTCTRPSPQLAGQDRAQGRELELHPQVVLDRRAFRKRGRGQTIRALGRLRPGDLAGQHNASADPLHPDALQALLTCQERAKRCKVQAHGQVVLDQETCRQ